ncbi:glycerate kinase [Virgibacillus indicus]|uniref:Glycerate kinase n=1 Tax=Virgibacillus indicus TaxID=2024554 RepID=A0A265N8M4_9BACI|nr:glycerate kinase [Virgibacillus indicus]OZU88151.1 glycerate kinase [Virgibacillus indicus]
MKIIVAPDSFKGSLTSTQASEVIKKSILKVQPSSDVVLKPMADGGEGTLETLLTATDGEQIPIACTGPLGEKIDTAYAIVEGNTAIIECASIAGLVQVPQNKRNPDVTTSFGIGEVIIDALNKGCTNFVIGLGGSATNDGGLGMLQALGMKALDYNGKPIGIYGKDLQQIKKANFNEIDSRLSEIKIKIACDVDNPLCGKRGASAVYGPQKGATAKQIEHYDQSLNNYGDLIETELNQSLKDIPGAGAAGGLGFAMLAIGANLVSGAELLAETIKAEESIQVADLVITGEGQSDEQTLFGKAPGFIASLAKKHHVPVVLISGSLSGDLDVLRERFSGCFSITNKPLSLEACMENAEELLYEQTKQIIHLICSF